MRCVAAPCFTMPSQQAREQKASGLPLMRKTPPAILLPHAEHAGARLAV
jgi:hypothetical protein